MDYVDEIINKIRVLEDKFYPIEDKVREYTRVIEATARRLLPIKIKFTNARELAHKYPENEEIKRYVAIMSRYVDFHQQYKSLKKEINDHKEIIARKLYRASMRLKSTDPASTQAVFLYMAAANVTARTSHKIADTIWQYRLNPDIDEEDSKAVSIDDAAWRAGILKPYSSAEYDDNKTDTSEVDEVDEDGYVSEFLIDETPGPYLEVDIDGHSKRNTMYSEWTNRERKAELAKYRRYAESFDKCFCDNCEYCTRVSGGPKDEWYVEFERDEEAVARGETKRNIERMTAVAKEVQLKAENDEDCVCDSEFYESECGNLDDHCPDFDPCTCGDTKEEDEW